MTSQIRLQDKRNNRHARDCLPHGINREDGGARSPYPALMVLSTLIAKAHG